MQLTVGTFHSDMPVTAHTVDFWVLTGIQAAQQVEGLGGDNPSSFFLTPACHVRTVGTVSSRLCP